MPTGVQVLLVLGEIVSPAMLTIEVSNLEAVLHNLMHCVILPYVSKHFSSTLKSHGVMAHTDLQEGVQGLELPCSAPLLQAALSG